MRKEHNTKECSIEDCEELNYSSSTQCYTHLRQSSNNSDRTSWARLSYPTPSDKCVYAIKNPEGEIVYVGKSKNTSYRLWEHLSGKRSGSMQFYRDEIPEDLSKYTHDILWHGDNDIMHKQQEKIMIEKHQPKYNKQYKHG